MDPRDGHTPSAAVSGPVMHPRRGADRAADMSLSRQKLLDRFDLFRSGLLLGDHVIEPEHHQGVGIREHLLIDRQSLPGLIDPLVNDDRLSSHLADDRSGIALSRDGTAQGYRQFLAGTPSPNIPASRNSAMLRDALPSSSKSDCPIR